MADSRTGLADVLTLPIFSLFLFCFVCFSIFLSFAKTLLTKASFLSSFSFSQLFTLLSLSLIFPGIEEGTCRFQVADSRTGLADILALPTFSLFPVLFSSLFLPTLFHLRSSSTQLENRLFVVVFHSIFISVFAEV